METQWMVALAGGGLLGLGGALLWAGLGRTVGISGIAGGVVGGKPDRDWRVAFLLGLSVAGALLSVVMPGSFRPTASAAWPAMPTIVLAGLLVGVGTRIGNGCTSGHGVCGVSRMSKRSTSATLTFVAVGALTVAALRVLGGAS